MENIIKKALEGRYENYECTCESTESNPEGVCKNMRSGLPCCSEKEIILDPLFWQILGKACRVPCGEHYEEKGYCVNCDGKGYHAPVGIGTGIRFHEINLTEGWDKAIIYLAEVTK